MDRLAQDVGNRQLSEIAESLDAFREANGRMPRDLGEWVVVGRLRPSLLEIPGDDLAEPVLHDGEAVARSSYRFYADGLSITPQDEIVEAVLVQIRPQPNQRLVMAKDGTVYQTYSEMAQQSIDEIERVLQSTVR